MCLHTDYISTDYELKWSRLFPPTPSRQVPVATVCTVAVWSIMERLCDALWRGCIMHCGEATLTLRLRDAKWGRDINTTTLWCKMEKIY